MVHELLKLIEQKRGGGSERSCLSRPTYMNLVQLYVAFHPERSKVYFKKASLYLYLANYKCVNYFFIIWIFFIIKTTTILHKLYGLSCIENIWQQKKIFTANNF